MDKKKQAQLINEWATKGTSYRNLETKYKINLSTVHRMIARHKKKQEEEQLIAAANQALPDDMEVLKNELRKARLLIELQTSMLDISSKELGVDLRKKHGTRQSI